LILLAVIALICAVVFAWDKISIPDSFYPEELFTRFASWVDLTFYGVPEEIKPMTKPILKPIDHALGGIGAWLTDHGPKSPGQKASLAKSEAENQADGGGSGVQDYDATPDIETGGMEGTNES
jgi:hypothetical protein